MRLSQSMRRIAHLEGLEHAESQARATASLKKPHIEDAGCLRRVAHLKSLEKADAAARATILVKRSVEEEAS